MCCMAASTIMLSVDSETARIYDSASAEEQRKLQVLLRLRLRELTSQPKRTLNKIMDDIGAQAESRGLTPEVLESLLDER
jgi:hypothetical protein